MVENPEEIITIVEKGKLYLAAYWVDDEGTITVLSIVGHKSTPLGSLPPVAVAETLLREIIRDSR